MPEGLFNAAGTGQGHHVDASQQEAVIWTQMSANGYAPLTGVSLSRMGSTYDIRGAKLRVMPACKDGYVSATIGGFGEAGARTVLGLLRWMAEEEFLPREQLEPLLNRNWLEWSPMAMTNLEGEALQREIDSVHGPIHRFLKTKTMAELLERAVKEGMLIAPC